MNAQKVKSIVKYKALDKKIVTGNLVFNILQKSSEIPTYYNDIENLYANKNLVHIRARAIYIL